MDSSCTGLTKKHPFSVSHDNTKKLPQPQNRKDFSSDQTLKVFKDCEEINNDKTGNTNSIYGDRKLAAVAEKCQRECKNRPNRPSLKDNTDTSLELKKQKHALNKISDENSCNEVSVLEKAIHVEKKALQHLKKDLDEERKASSLAAKDALAMIARLQEEKAAVLMEAHQFKRMAEERELHNRKVLSVLKEMLHNKEEEALALENEYLLATCCTGKILFSDQSLKEDLSPVLVKQSCNVTYETGSRTSVECGFSDTCNNILRNNMISYNSFISGDEEVFEEITQSCSNELKELIPSRNSKDLNCVYSKKKRIDSGSDQMSVVPHDDALLEERDADPIALLSKSNDVVKRIGPQPKKFKIGEGFSIAPVHDTTVSSTSQIFNYETNNSKFQVKGNSPEAQNNHQCDLKASDYCGNGTNRNGLMGNMNSLAECNVMHDVYEVEYIQSNQASARHYTVIADNINIDNRSGCYEKPDVPPELVSYPIQETSLTTVYSSSSRNASNSTISSTGSEFTQLIGRLEALESEKQYAKEAILALRKENEELKSFHEIAFHLQYLKKTVQISKLPEQSSSFFSFFKGFKSLIPTRFSHKIKASSTIQHGLSSVLEKCTDLGRGATTVLIKRLKVKEVEL